MYDVVHQNAPANVCNLFTFVSNVHSYSTRSSFKKLTHTIFMNKFTYKKILCRKLASVLEQNSRRFENDVKEKVQRKIKIYFIQQFGKLCYNVEISKLGFS